MKVFAYIFVALLACVAAYDVELLSEEKWDQLVERNPAKPDTQGLILNGSAKKVLNALLEQMPCGWPEYGIPPLAPYTNADLKIHLAESFVESMLQFLRFRFDGLENMEIKKLKISYTFNKKVQFHIKFKQLKASAHFLDTDTFVDMLKQLGLSVRYESSGPMSFALENLSIQGQFKYKMPFMFGSIKIYKFQCAIGLGGVSSNIGGVMGNGRINEFINDMIEYEVPAFINGQQAAISKQIEEIFVPMINQKLKGHKIWYLLSKISLVTGTCNPTPAPWLAVESRN
ncbi:uncharacterized protein LOC117584692 [Drosophila guanche]|uniref:Uncharacterized protein n=1 Tax=Drosophila guanche TaxID=7266 RepID=A0A3B0JJJ4_DROGU|nr:uncharacterized protein LOC117584692 [Drosophila guanche]SPP82527.1 Hypothetical predicted protein [Drosophila guanche]